MEPIDHLLSALSHWCSLKLLWVLFNHVKLIRNLFNQVPKLALVWYRWLTHLLFSYNLLPHIHTRCLYLLLILAKTINLRHLWWTLLKWWSVVWGLGLAVLVWWSLVHWIMITKIRLNPRGSCTVLPAWYLRSVKGLLVMGVLHVTQRNVWSHPRRATTILLLLLRMMLLLVHL